MNLNGERRSNATYRSTADPEARLYKRTYGSEARLRYLSHALIENRTRWMVKTRVTFAEGTAERDAALGMAKQIRGSKCRTLAADKNYDARANCDGCASRRSRPRTPRTGRVRLAVARHGTPAMWSVRRNASACNRASAVCR